MATKKVVKKKKRAVTKKVEALVLRVIERITEEPLRFNMSIVGKKRIASPERLAAAGLPPCGTVGCFAGWAIIEDAKMRNAKDPFTDGGYYHIVAEPRGGWERAAGKLFGISLKKGSKLFHVSGWPKIFRDRYRNSYSHEERADVGVRRLKSFVRTGR